MAYVTETVKKFRGMNQSKSGVSLSPEWALSCVNVIPDTASGALMKLRIPVALSEAIAGLGSGPSQFAMYENSLTGTKQIVAFFGPDVYVFDLDAFTPTIIDSNADYDGPTPMSSAVANNELFFQNGVTVPLKFSAAGLQFWGIQKGKVPTLGAPFGTGITLATGRMYRAAYKNSVNGAVGTASDPSASTGPIADQSIPVTIPAPDTDGQIDSARLYATLDGGSDYFFHSEVTGPFPILVNDDIPDAGLDQSERAPLINDPPPYAKYLVKWGARIFGANITRESIVNGSGPNPQGIFYTGYNRILVGRPEEAVPPGNRLLLETGADAISGLGIIAAGVIAFDKTNKMFMFRGQPEDIVTNAPVEFTLYLQQLPWDIGCSGHFTIQSTPYGLVWRTPDRQVRLFNGTDEPDIISSGIEPIMKRITANTETNERSAYWSLNERNWYVLACAVDGTTQPDLNMILVFDMEPSDADNVGIFAFDLSPIGPFQSIGVIEMVTGDQKLMIGQGGLFKELTVASKLINGITQDPTFTTGVLPGNWRSAYFGNENQTQSKFMQFSIVSADASGFSVKRYLVNDLDSTMAQPEILEVEPIEGPSIFTGRETKRMSVELQFPPQDRDCAVQLLANSYTPGAERPY
jgi:hypothetical protein